MRKINIRGFNNKYCKQHNLKLMQGEGYLYWVYLGEENIQWPDSIYYATFKQLVEDRQENNRWVYNPNLTTAKEVLQDAIKQVQQSLKDAN